MRDDYEKNSLAENLYYIGSIASIMKMPTSSYLSKIGVFTAEVEINDEIKICSSFSSLGPDQFSIKDYELDKLNVSILKNDKCVKTILFEKRFNSSQYAYIDASSYSMEDKLNHIMRMAPNFLESFNANRQLIGVLTQEEIELVKLTCKNILSEAKEQVIQERQKNNNNSIKK